MVKRLLSLWRQQRLLSAPLLCTMRVLSPFGPQCSRAPAHCLATQLAGRLPNILQLPSRSQAPGRLDESGDVVTVTSARTPARTLALTVVAMEDWCATPPPARVSLLPLLQSSLWMQEALIIMMYLLSMGIICPSVSQIMLGVGFQAALWT